MSVKHDEKSKAARDALLDRVAELTPKYAGEELKHLADAYRAVMDVEPSQPGKVASL